LLEVFWHALTAAGAWSSEELQGSLNSDIRGSDVKIKDRQSLAHPFRVVPAMEFAHICTMGSGPRKCIEPFEIR